jgi:hypothetical protein
MVEALIPAIAVPFFAPHAERVTTYCTLAKAGPGFFLTGIQTTF